MPRWYKILYFVNILQEIYSYLMHIPVHTVVCSFRRWNKFRLENRNNKKPMIHSNIPKNSVTICVDPFNVILFFCAIVILCVVSCSWLWISLALFCEGGNNRPFEFKFELSRIWIQTQHNTLRTHNAERSPRNKRSHVTYELRWAFHNHAANTA